MSFVFFSLLCHNKNTNSVPRGRKSGSSHSLAWYNQKIAIIFLQMTSYDVFSDYSYICWSKILKNTKNTKNEILDEKVAND